MTETIHTKTGDVLYTITITNKQGLATVYTGCSNDEVLETYRKLLDLDLVFLRIKSSVHSIQNIDNLSLRRTE